MFKKITDSLAENLPAATLAFVTLFLHFATNFSGGYGYFRDEFYYIACTDHLDWGYVDHPPFSIVFLWLNRLFLGDSLFALRFLPAVSSATLVYLTGLIVREFGGGKLAQWIACISVAIAPVLLIVSDFYSMNVFEPLFWMSCAYVLIKIINSENQKLWLVFGILAGLGLQNKHSMLFFGFALVVGLVLTNQRKQLVSKRFWFGGVIAAILFLPNIFWQFTHDWATLEFMRNAQQWKNALMSPMEFFLTQILFQHPFTFPIWLIGVLAFFFHNDLKKYRLFGFTFIVLLVLFIVQRGKPYYLSPIYPVILSAGAVAFEQFVNNKNWRWLSRASVALLIIGGLATLPAFLPLLPIEMYIHYANTLGLPQPKMERHGDTVLPQVFADRFGWKEMTKEVATAYNSLTPEEKSVAAIYTQNYGEAGAIDFFGTAYELPRATSGHNSYWHWGLRGYSGEVLIIIGGNAEDHAQTYESVQQFSIHRNQYAMPYETNVPIFICKKPKVPLKDIWSRVRHYI
ncbi:MAG: glycosyltransferase family 39 protein [Ignavibacteriales bacterium]|nr:glycosyltransferase family 39 protein [Ignavibacteriales bacterium]